MIIDGHWDTGLFLREQSSIINLPQAHGDLQRLNQHLDGAFLAIFIHPQRYANNQAQEFASLFWALVADVMEQESLCRILRYKQQLKSGQKFVVIGAEGCGFFNGDYTLLKHYYLAGLRFVGLTWNYRNHLAGGASDGGSISPEGQKLIEFCNGLGILLDGAHLSRESFYQLTEMSRQPFMVSHAACDALFSHRRNLDDAQLKRLSACNGVIGISLAVDFLGPDPGIKTVCEHIEHAVEQAGIDHVGIGTDFDGAEVVKELAGAQYLSRLWQLLADRGWSDQNIAKVAGGNFALLLERVLKE